MPETAAATRFLYHACPPELFGDVLYPLANLAELNPKLYARELSKYSDHPARRRIPWARVAKLGCARRETLNFAPVHPQLIYRAWFELGITLPATRWFSVPVRRFGGLPAVIYTPSGGDAGADLTDAEVSWFSAETYRELTELPPETLTWYRQLLETHRRGGWFARVPHVLVKGPVSVAGLEAFGWSASG